jgi:hypothetical protein
MHIVAFFSDSSSAQSESAYGSREPCEEHFGRKRQISSTSFPDFDLETQGVIRQLPARSDAESTESR